MAGQTPTVQQLCDAAQAGDLAQVEEILAQNALLARQPITQNGQLAIQFAAREGYAEIVAALLAAGADAEKLPFAELLIDYGADLETRDDELQSTPLGHACRYGLAKLAALLLAHGASVEPLAGAPWTAPLAWAEQQGHAEIAALLQSRT